MVGGSISDSRNLHRGVFDEGSCTNATHTLKICALHVINHKNQTIGILDKFLGWAWHFSIFCDLHVPFKRVYNLWILCTDHDSNAPYCYKTNMTSFISNFIAHVVY